MAENRAPRAILIVVGYAFLAYQGEASVSVLKVEQVIARDVVTSLADGTERTLLVTDQLPIIAIITLAIVAEPRYFLPLAQRRLIFLVGVQVLARWVVLEAYCVSTFEARAGDARTAIALSSLHDPQSVSLIFVLSRCDHLLLGPAAVVSSH